MPDDQRAIKLKQLANIVIDAYLNRDKQFTPAFEPDTQAVIYLSRPDTGHDHPGLRTNVWYERSEYEVKESPSEQEKKHSSRQN